MTVNTNGPEPEYSHEEAWRQGEAYGRPDTAELDPDEAMVIYRENGDEIVGTRRDGWQEVGGIAPDSSYDDPRWVDQRWDPSLPPGDDPE